MGRLLRRRPPTTRHQVENKVKQTFPSMLISNMLRVFHCAASTCTPAGSESSTPVLSWQETERQAREPKHSQAAGKVAAIIATSSTHLEPNPAPRARLINAFFGPVV